MDELRAQGVGDISRMHEEQLDWFLGRKRSEQNKKNRSKLTVNHAAGSRSFQRTRACMERMDAFQRQCDLEGKTYTKLKYIPRYWARSRDMFGD
ncbi:hypothetical protein CJ030_MR6G010340 [Morella rubra]|uniref:Uncharacterized protein n=1 Tax=Morella rubra TaxID=262757 RepID=A0A6A1WU91_9ROSI|nr:hypothetical protein CJ030_MR6G010340 [Morella rubra]